MMRISPAVLFLSAITVCVPAQPQGRYGPVSPVIATPRLDFAAGYNYIRANAPPGGAERFSLNGGFGSVGLHFTRYLAAAAEVSGSKASRISALGQNLTLITVLGGPRVTYPVGRYVPFGQALFGVGHGGDSLFPQANSTSTSATNFAYSVGGGVDVNLTPRFAVRAIEAQYLYTTFPNGTTNQQNQLVIGAGIVIKTSGFHRTSTPPPPPPLPPPPPAPVATPAPANMHFNCSLSKNHINPGETLHIVGDTATEPDGLEVMFAWMPDAGMIEGSGRNVNLNTAALRPGHYNLRGHAIVVGEHAASAECNLPFDIDQPSTPLPSQPESVVADTSKEVEFHANVPDAYFDYNSATLRPDAAAASSRAAYFLNSHQGINVRVEGFADERGSVEFNLILGQQRALAARNALIKAGVESSRIEIISYGKAEPVCKEAVEQCYRQNRRAAFSLHP